MTLTNREIGEMIGLTHSAVSRLLSGGRVPSVATMKNIAKVFERDLDEVVNAASNGKTNEDRASHWGSYFTSLIREWDQKQSTTNTEQADVAAV